MWFKDLIFDVEVWVTADNSELNVNNKEIIEFVHRDVNSPQDDDK